MEKFHFIAIGGIGQSALAKILAQSGHIVSGSDIYDSKYLDELRSMGVKISIGHNRDNIVDGAKIVVSTAIKEDNPELIRAKELGLEILHRSDALKFISKKYKKFIGFSGTHGKTTTSGLCAYILSQINVDVGYAIGGIIPKLKTNGNAGKSDYFVAELDESDGTILKYTPYLTVVNNLEADHFDFYQNGLSQIFSTFETYIKNLSLDSKIVINIDDKGNLAFVEKYLKDREYTTFSTKTSADFEARDIELNPQNSKFSVYYKNEFLGEINLKVVGMHNVYNALSVISALCTLGFDFDLIAPHFSTFTGMGRRFQLVQEFRGIKVIDDYAHHPTEIKTTLKAAKKYADNKRLVAIFQPHRYTRFKGLWGEFLNSFDDVDVLFVLDVYKAGENKIDGFDSVDFSEQIKIKNVQYIKGTIKEAAEKIYPQLEDDDVVLTLGAGDITKMGEALYGMC